jgi:hypothetical protein
VTLDFALDDLRHQAVHRAATGGYLLKNGGAILICRDGILDALKLALNAIDAGYQFLLVVSDVTQDY